MWGPNGGFQNRGTFLGGLNNKIRAIVHWDLSWDSFIKKETTKYLPSLLEIPIGPSAPAPAVGSSFFYAMYEATPLIEGNHVDPWF